MRESRAFLTLVDSLLLTISSIPFEEEVIVAVYDR